MFYPIFLGSIIVFNLLLGLTVLIKNPRSHINVSFSFFVFSTVIWMIANTLSNQITDYELAFLLNKLIFLVTPYMAYFLLYFALVFPKGFSRFKIDFPKLFLLIIPVIISNLLTLFNLTITQITFLPEGGTGVVFSPFSAVYAIQFIGYVGLAITILVYKLFKLKGHEKVQLQYLLLGISFMMIVGTITNLIIPYFFNSFSIVDFGPILTLSVVAFTSYAILKHSLLDIRFIVARSVTFVLLLAILGILYVGSIFGISSVLLNNGQYYINPTFLYAVLALFIAITAHPLRQLLSKMTAKIFFKNDYNSDELLSKLTKILASEIQLQNVTHKTLAELIQTLKISNGMFLVYFSEDKYEFITEGLKEEQRVKEKYTSDIIKGLFRHRKIWFLEDEEENNKQFFRDLGISIIIPLMVGNKFQGLLILGDKKTGEIYARKDINVLNIFGPEISVALENAKSYEEILRFNITLKEEVDRQTKDLQIANQRLEQLDKLKDEFVSLASHELRTPMTVIKSYIWMLLYNSGKELDPKEKTYLERAYGSTERLIKLVNDMLNVSRIESGRLKLEMKDLDIVELVTTVTAELTPRAQELGLKMYLNKPDTAVKKLNGDSDRIEQILINFIGNSLKFTPPEGSITVSLIAGEKDVLISISDTGRGIKSEDMHKLFQKFGMIGSAYLQKSQNQGSGLGLYLSKSLIELHGGRVRVESGGENKGSTFSFTLPYNEDKPHQEADVLPASAAAAGAGASSGIGVVAKGATGALGVPAGAPAEVMGDVAPGASNGVK